jgi:hypothetical protein
LTASPSRITKDVDVGCEKRQTIAIAMVSSRCLRARLWPQSRTVQLQYSDPDSVQWGARAGYCGGGEAVFGVKDMRLGFLLPEQDSLVDGIAQTKNRQNVLFD